MARNLPLTPASKKKATKTQKTKAHSSSADLPYSQFQAVLRITATQ